MRFHEERLLPLGPRDEVLPRHEKLPRGQNLDGKLLGQFFRGHLFVVVVRLRQQDSLRLVLLDVGSQLRLPRHPASESMVVHRPSRFSHLLGKVPLRREEQNQSLFVIL